MKEVELLIIGAGPAGMSAAIEAVKAGVKVTMLDENSLAGGQIFRQFHDGFHVTDPKALGHDYKRGQTLISEFEDIKNDVEYLDACLSWGFFEDNEIAFLRNENSQSFRFHKLIISTGAYDRPVPFPGWTLPGVLTAGGAQRLVKNQQVLPGENILLVGSGPLQLALASQIIEIGGKVAGIVEAGRVENWGELARASWGQWTLLSDAAHYFWKIGKAKIPFLRNHIIVEARGNGQVEEAIIAEVDKNWRPKPGTEKIFKVDTVAVGYGFIPSTELTQMAGCQHRYDPLLGGWIVDRMGNMGTSLPDVFAAGDCTGVAGSLVAIDEGRIAGLAVAQTLGYLTKQEARQRMHPYRKSLARSKKFRKAMDAISLPRPGLYELAQKDTMICRCREIALGEIQEVLQEEIKDINEIKRRLGIGMGPCQGRMCESAILAIVAKHKKIPPADLGFLNPRPPLKPVLLSALADHTQL